MKRCVYTAKEQLFDFEYLTLPKWIINYEINGDAKLLYALLRDRLLLSMKNKMVDDEGKPYIIYSRKEVQDKLKISDNKCTKIFVQLKEAGLIIDKAVGQGKTNRIYLLIPENVNNNNCDNNDSKIVNIKNLKSEKTRINDNNFSNTENRKYVVVDKKRFLNAIENQKNRYDEAYKTEENTNKAIQYAIDSFNCFGDDQISKINQLCDAAYEEIFKTAFDFANEIDSFHNAYNPKKVLCSVIKKYIKNIKR